MNANILRHWADRAGCSSDGKCVFNLWIKTHALPDAESTMVRLESKRIEGVTQLAVVANSMITSGHCTQWCVEFQSDNGIAWECWAKGYGSIVENSPDRVLETYRLEEDYDYETDRTVGIAGDGNIE